MRIPIGDQIANRSQAVGNRVRGNHFAIYANPLSERDQVRGCEEAGAMSLRATDRIDHGANGAFAVCSGHVNDASSAKIHMQLCKESPDVFQAKLDAEALKAVKPGERLFVSQRWLRHPLLRFARACQGGLSYIHGVIAK